MTSIKTVKDLSDDELVSKIHLYKKNACLMKISNKVNGVTDIISLNMLKKEIALLLAEKNLRKS